MFDYRILGKVKSPIFSLTITLAALIFIIYQNIIICQVPSEVAPFGAKEIPEAVQAQNTERTIKAIVSHVALHSVQDKAVEVTSRNHDPPLAPLNVSEGERIAWLRKRIPEFKIFKSNNLTKQFHGRVMQFINQECEVQFFMTWISPVNSFGRREFLALESLFNVHPHGCLMIISRTMDSVEGFRILKPLIDRGCRVTAVTPDLTFLFRNTPAEAWFHEMKEGNKDPGEIPLAQNLSNLIRLAILYKYGGVYLDTDFIVLKSFKGLRNSIGAQSIDVSGHWTRLNNAVLVFDMNHPLLYKFMEEFASTFDGNKWGHNGPYLVSRVVQKVERRPGYNFTVLQPMAFYPVDWNRIGGLFKMPENRADSKWVKAKLLQLSRETYGVHLWNKQSSRLKVEEGSVIGKLISSHCIICQYSY